MKKDQEGRIKVKKDHGETSNLKNYNLSEAYKYNVLSKVQKFVPTRIQSCFATEKKSDLAIYITAVS